LNQQSLRPGLSNWVEILHTGAYGCQEPMELLKSTSVQIQDARRRPNCTYWNRGNCTTDCSILLKCGTWVHHGSAEGAELLTLHYGPHKYTREHLKLQCIATATLLLLLLN